MSDDSIKKVGELLADKHGFHPRRRAIMRHVDETSAKMDEIIKDYRECLAAVARNQFEHMIERGVLAFIVPTWMTWRDIPSMYDPKTGHAMIRTIDVLDAYPAWKTFADELAAADLGYKFFESQHPEKTVSDDNLFIQVPQPVFAFHIYLR